MKIAVIDSGAPEKSKLNITNKYRIFVNQDYESYVLKDRIEDENGHATLVFKILEKYLKKAEEIISIKILNKELMGNSIALAKAIEFAVNEKCNLINISLGTPNKEFIKRNKNAVKYADEKGVMIVAAHSNGIKEISYPASFNNVIGVKGIDEKKVSIDFKNNNINMETWQRLEDEEEIIEISGSSYLAPHITRFIVRNI
ncbi:subtilase family protein [Hypnocyclicus thermotrophus]|uniref:Subtilase family protein n=1 Tax=Hypnocyclicus thermotrophus TaxID=1627895 RepID=A0AA46E0I1_9FUSO|nr:S8 family serine peptidase [Hypnocyclicus thermotrophus]TDT72501.1 subtilase family protein [Hypnocyclicus thermotrophus]